VNGISRSQLYISEIKQFVSLFVISVQFVTLLLTKNVAIAKALQLEAARRHANPHLL